MRSQEPAARQLTWQTPLPVVACESSKPRILVCLQRAVKSTSQSRMQVNHLYVEEQSLFPLPAAIVIIGRGYAPPILQH